VNDDELDQVLRNAHQHLASTVRRPVEVPAPSAKAPPPQRPGRRTLLTVAALVVVAAGVGAFSLRAAQAPSSSTSAFTAVRGDKRAVGYDKVSMAGWAHAVFAATVVSGTPHIERHGLLWRPRAAVYEVRVETVYKGLPHVDRGKTLRLRAFVGHGSEDLPKFARGQRLFLFTKPDPGECATQTIKVHGQAIPTSPENEHRVAGMVKDAVARSVPWSDAPYCGSSSG